MNYQHAFHAGNFADVHKHAVLARILVHLRGKPAAFRVIDTHAGAGRYDLFGPEPSRSGEWRGGIKKVWDAFAAGQSQGQGEAKGGARAEAARDLLAPYLEAVAAVNPGGTLRTYPGSPLVATALLRRQDRLIACELERRTAVSLKNALRGDARAKAIVLDGWTALNAYVPPKERRGLVLVDPPFEDAADFNKLSSILAAAHRKWPTGVYMLWYPIKDRDAPDALARSLKRNTLPALLRCEISLGPPRNDLGLVGSGLILVNPPFKLDAELKVLLPALADLLSPQATSQIDWLAAEK
jgi:23S rRNA (adenine2030-N6)-methyltransferase